MLSARNVPLNTVFWIGIYADGDWAANGEITVSAYDPANQQNSPVELSDGLPTNDVLALQEYRYYRYILDSTTPIASLSFAVIQKIGDPDFFINGPGMTAWPRQGVAQYSSNAIGHDIITIKNPAMGIYRIAVLAWDQDIQYQIIAVKSSGSLTMTDGVSYPAYLEQDDYAYYQFQVLDASAFLVNSTLTISARNLVDETDLDIYCSKVDSRPSNTSYQWSSTAWGRDIVIISGRTGNPHAGHVLLRSARLHLRQLPPHRHAAEQRGCCRTASTSTSSSCPPARRPSSTSTSTAPTPPTSPSARCRRSASHQLYVSHPNGAEPNYLQPGSWAIRDISTSYRGHSVLIPGRWCNATTAISGPLPLPGHRVRADGHGVRHRGGERGRLPAADQRADRVRHRRRPTRTATSPSSSPTPTPPSPCC